MTVKQANKKYIIDIGHPANVHIFKHMYYELESDGWQGIFTVIRKEMTIELLNRYRLPYLILGRNKKSVVFKVLSELIISMIFLYHVISMRPMLIIGRGSLHAALVAKITGIHHIILSDTENAGFLNRVTEKLIDVVLTSTSYKTNHGDKQIRYPGYHELAYLHPNVFTPESDVLTDMNIFIGQKYAIVRFVAWQASHDSGHVGISRQNKIYLVRELSKRMPVFVSSEIELPPEIEQYRIHLGPDRIHHLMAFAHVYIGESATMASECACLGVPAIYLDNVGRGYTDNLESDYGLVHNYTESEDDQVKAIELALSLAECDTHDSYQRQRDHMLSEKIDVTMFLVWFIKNYPNSIDRIRNGDFSRFMGTGKGY